MEKLFTGQTPQTMAATISDGFNPSMKKISVGSALMIPIRDKLEQDERETIAAAAVSRTNGQVVPVHEERQSRRLRSARRVCALRQTLDGEELRRHEGHCEHLQRTLFAVCARRSAGEARSQTASTGRIAPRSNRTPKWPVWTGALAGVHDACARQVRVR